MAPNSLVNELLPYLLWWSMIALHIWVMSRYENSEEAINDNPLPKV